MYLWALVGRDPGALPILSGSSRDVAHAMREVEPMLKDGRAFIAVIEEVRIRIAVAGLEEHYVATGRTWNGRRTRDGGVHWHARLSTQDASAIYQIPGDPRLVTPAEPAEAELGTGPGDVPDADPPPGHAPR